MEIELIIQGCIDNDQKSHRLLFNMFYNNVKFVCGKYTMDDDTVNELTKETFISCFKNIYKFDGRTIGKVRNWLLTIARNKAMDHHRSLKKTQCVELYDGFSEEVEESSIYAIFYNDLTDVINGLTPKYREVINLYYGEGKPHKEIGEILGITEGTSKSNLYKAKKKMKNSLLKLKPNF